MGGTQLHREPQATAVTPTPHDRSRVCIVQVKMAGKFLGGELAGEPSIFVSSLISVGIKRQPSGESKSGVSAYVQAPTADADLVQGREQADYSFWPRISPAGATELCTLA